MIEIQKYGTALRIPKVSNLISVNWKLSSKKWEKGNQIDGKQEFQPLLNLSYRKASLK